MVGAGIHDGDEIIVDQAIDPCFEGKPFSNNDCVVARSPASC